MAEVESLFLFLHRSGLDGWHPPRGGMKIHYDITHLGTDSLGFKGRCLTWTQLHRNWF